MKKLIFCFALLSVTICQAQHATAPKVLLVMAHPDDETECAVTVYKITKELNGTVDMAVITNGEGGYKYSTLAEDYYDFELTEESIGRKYLPLIRKEELKNAGKILGIHQYFFLDQQDQKYTTDERNPLDTVWNTAFVSQNLEAILAHGAYDFVFCLLPVNETHGHHKAATILLLQAVQTLPQNQRPAVLAVSSMENGKTIDFESYKDYAETQIHAEAPLLTVDRTTPIGFKRMLNYKVILNWVIAEHKSQGALQMTMGKGDHEQFWFFALNDAKQLAKAIALFEKLKEVPYPSKVYAQVAAS